MVALLQHGVSIAASRPTGDLHNDIISSNL